MGTTEVQAQTQNRVIAVVGLGFVGLPLALSFSLAGQQVYGVEVSETLVSELKRGITYHTEANRGVPIQDILVQESQSGRFVATTDPSIFEQCTDIVVTVGMPIKGGKPDKTPLVAAVRGIVAHLKPGHLILLRSTMVPGTVEEDVVPLLEESGLKADEDFYVAYASERIAEGRAFEEFASMPVTLAGIGPGSVRRATELLKTISHADIVVSASIKAVETSKALENMYRDINIAIVNEMAEYCRSIGVDILEVIRLANTHSRVNLLTPGAGVGGYCIPNAFYYMAGAIEEGGLTLARVARRVNDQVPASLANLLMSAIHRAGVSHNSSKVAVLGLAMKDHSNDDRQSPVHDFIRQLEQAGVEVVSYDPNVHSDVVETVESEEEALVGADAVAIMVDQNGINYDPAFFARHVKPGAVVFEVKRLVEGELIRQFGFRYLTI